MSEYTVTWTIEVTADNPTEAAMQARMILLDPESEAVHFDVSRFGNGIGEREAVDLNGVDFTRVII